MENKAQKAEQDKAVNQPEKKLTVNNIPAGNAPSDLDPEGKVNTSINNTTDHSGTVLNNFAAKKDPEKDK